MSADRCRIVVLEEAVALEVVVSIVANIIDSRWPQDAFFADGELNILSAPHNEFYHDYIENGYWGNVDKYAPFLKFADGTFFVASNTSIALSKYNTATKGDVYGYNAFLLQAQRNYEEGIDGLPPTSFFGKMCAMSDASDDIYIVMDKGGVGAHSVGWYKTDKNLSTFHAGSYFYADGSRKFPSAFMALTTDVSAYNGYVYCTNANLWGYNYVDRFIPSDFGAGLDSGGVWFGTSALTGYREGCCFDPVSLKLVVIEQKEETPGNWIHKVWVAGMTAADFTAYNEVFLSLSPVDLGVGEVPLDTGSYSFAAFDNKLYVQLPENPIQYENATPRGVAVFDLTTGEKLVAAGTTLWSPPANYGDIPFNGEWTGSIGVTLKG